MADDGSPITGKRSAANSAMLETAFLYGGSAVWIEKMQAAYARDPKSVPDSWRDFFAQLGDGDEAATRNADGASWKRERWPKPADADQVAAFDGNWTLLEPKLKEKIKSDAPAASAEDIANAVKDSIRALMMIRAYRVRGHLAANLDPLAIDNDATQPELDPASYGFTDADMDRSIYIDGYLGLDYATIPEMVDILRRTYCSTVGIEFQHISSPEEKAWLQERIEGPDKGVAFTPEGKKAILAKLIEAETFERFLHRRYPGTKRFGLDGGEAAVPALEQIIKRGGALGVNEIVVGMPHRGRLNMLAAVMGKPYEKIFHEFQGGSTQGAEGFGSGDVKYHLGASSDRAFDGNEVHLTMNANPSHLEAVNPVVLGRTRAKQAMEADETGTLDRSHKLPLLLHGDAAFAGQGVVSECFALSGLAGYRTGGTIHFIVNNQIGFTTSPMYSRSSPYPSDVALMVQAPIFHVNGDDPEAVTYCAKVATEYRQKFGKDVVIDMFCYRRFGHNEGDEPMFTQPVMYSQIKTHESTREIYAKRLVEEGLVSEDEVKQQIKDFEDFLDKAFDDGKTFEATKADWLDGEWSGLGLPEDDERRGKTGVAIKKLKEIGETITTVPDNVDIHKTLRRVIDARREAIETGHGLDWATAEHLAFATLLEEGFPVRLSGQDSGRGTFSQRHSHFVDQTSGARYTPLNNIADGQANYEVIDSLLSEEAVLGYEYGYSLADPNCLVLWEAQFGDFSNGAQVFFDQFISSAERKWLRMSGLVCLLPHGYEGQGPEHSSARLERFLQMCAEDNMQVVNLTTPANYFHALRRQIHRDFRKPLIIMTPKSLLRHKLATSSLDDFNTKSSFHRVLWDDAETPGREGKVKLTGDDKIRRVVMCSGKVYYDLFEAREERGIDDVYLLRIEQFYPVPRKSIMAELKRFTQAEMVWCQEEPRNMGGWTFMRDEIEWACNQVGAQNPRPKYAGRPPSAATATGLLSQHNKEKDALIAAALGDQPVEDSIVSA
ncbi:MAG: 2-oxoglutarate dehydrogenase E1 component [Hyphomonadaceae bacterium]|jgi:2-oxoglutarate dehydrogenase E1 component|uniref:2-oxoglutarate dehydrogenase E1 component n=1 Tax=Henriciella sp. TaxID=1968823 RepID=UPI000C0FC073|nr:2-oxoglutarate dehydrogenase E1 component [Henriciella sp.]MBF33192.1 2-oxoglutarate dehydrogenase E1 component [Hyphomonadaceae bacterium]PHR70748.1 MAG: 2-oxoglutarate dehydrogenase E1 component [Henriciella sp.]